MQAVKLRCFRDGVFLRSEAVSASKDVTPLQLKEHSMLLIAGHCPLMVAEVLSFLRNDSLRFPVFVRAQLFSGEHAIRRVDSVILISSRTMINPHSAAQSLVTCLLRLYLRSVPPFEKHPILSVSPIEQHKF